ncbi:MAG: prolipoprotein diacylglyceryl transferase [Hyphomonadaceae bacterium]
MIEAAMQFPNLDPSALTLPGFELFGAHLGPFHLRWYALAYIAGLVLGWRWMVWLIRRDSLWAPGRPAMSVPQADDFLFWATLGVILGGRVGYVLFYKPDMIWKHPAELIQIWQGGMSFHGGLIGVALAALWFTRQKHVNEEQYAKLAAKHAVEKAPAGEGGKYERFGEGKWILKTEAEAAREKSRSDSVDLLRLGDLAAAAAPLGLFFGRIANFINGELWGRVTGGPFGMIFCNDRIIAQNGFCPAGDEPRYPSQLFEAALEGIALFTIINIATLKFDTLRRPGMNVGIFLVCYGLFRAILETVREPDAHMPEALRGIITMGMLLSIPMIIAGAWLIYRALKRPKLAAA